MEGIQLSVKHTGVNSDISIIKVGGYIDTTTSAELEHSLETLIKAERYNIIIDLGNVDYISSAGWGIFISEIKGIREKNGDLKLVNMIPDVFEVFELLEFHYILKAFDSIEDAVADFDKRKVYAEDEKELNLEKEDTGNESELITNIKEDTHVKKSSDTIETNEKDGYPIENLTKTKSIEDKIRKIITENPEISSIRLMRLLKTEKYGNNKISFFKVLKYLKKMNLNSKKKRIEYFRKKNVL